MRKLKFVITLSFYLVLGNVSAQIPYGITSLVVEKADNIELDAQKIINNPKKGEVINTFFRVGGFNGSVTPSEVKLFWNDTALFMFYSCSVSNSLKELQDTENYIELYLNKYENPSEFYIFSCGISGKADAKCNPYERNQRIITDFHFKGNRTDTDYNGYLIVPWKTLGGKPNSYFGLQIQRSIIATGETDSPSALDFFDFSKPGNYIETTLGAKTHIGKINKTLCRLPSGTLFWQRPALISKLDVSEKESIWTLQQQLDVKTDLENLPLRINLLQRWYDLMVIEGFSFQRDAGCWVMPKGGFNPWDARKKINVFLWQKQIDSVCVVVDVLLKQFDKVSRNWFADGSPGNIFSQNWKQVTKVSGWKINKDYVELMGATANSTIKLNLTFTENKGIRFYTRKGFFDQAPLLFKADSSDNKLILTSAELKIIVVKGEDWNISVIDKSSGTLYYKINPDDLLFLYNEKEIKAFTVSGNIGKDENFYGFGERFDCFGHRGKILTLWDIDAWEGNFNGIFNQAYKVIPFFHSTQGYSMFMNCSYKIRCDMGYQDKSRFSLTGSGNTPDVYLWFGKPIENIKSFNMLTGMPVLPPRWAFEPWMGGGGGRWQQGTLKDPVKQMLAEADSFEILDIPHSAVYAEGYCSDAPEIYTNLLPKGIRPLAWTSPWIIPLNQIKQILNVEDNDLPLVHYKNKQIITSKNGLPGRFPTIDYFHPNASKLLDKYWKQRFDLGVAGSMIDFADVIPDSALFYNGKYGDEMHNIYCYEYHKMMSELFKRYKGDNYILFSRAAAPGSQTFLCQFAGDHQSNFNGLTAALHGGMNLMSSGFSNWGSDIGGYYGKPSDEVYIRWIEWGTFSPLMRFHGTQPREPWYYNRIAIPIYKKYSWVRESLVDYLYNAAVYASKTGLPMMLSLPVVFPEIKQLSLCEDEYMLGSSLLVAPIHKSENFREVFFPNGKWINLWTNKTFEGNKNQKVMAPIDEIPVFLKNGAIVPVQLPKSLKLGESLSHNRVSAILITKSDTLSEVQLTENRKIILKPATNGFTIETEDYKDLNYIIMCGDAAGVNKINIDGVEISKLTGNQILKRPVGWYVDEIGRLIIRLPMRKKLKIEIFNPGSNKSI